MIIKWKRNFKSETYDVVGIQGNCSKICWSISDLTLDFSWYGNVIARCLNTDSWEIGTCTILDRIHAKIGDRNLCILRGLVTIERDEDDRLESQDVRGWWVARDISGRDTGITTWWKDLVLCWFDSHVYGSFLFHLVA